MEESVGRSSTDNNDFPYHEIIEDAVEQYKDKYGFGEPVRANLNGVSEGENVDTVSGEYTVSGHDWELNFQILVTESDHTTDYFFENDHLDPDRYSKEFRSPAEHPQSRILTANPLPAEQHENHDKDRWHCFEKVLEDAVGSERTGRPSEYNKDAVYFIDAQENRHMEAI